MHRFSIEYPFEEIRLCGDALMAWGVAELVHDGDGEFYVDAVVLDGKRFTRNGYGSDQFFTNTNKDIFLTISAQIEASEDAQTTFAAALLAAQDGNPDRTHDDRRDLEAA